MTDALAERPKRTDRDIGGMLVGALVILVGNVVFLLLTGGWGAKEAVTEHKADIQVVRSEQKEATLELLAAIQRLKDAVCVDHKDVPQCR